MKKIIILLAVLAILSGIIYFLYPKYLLYQKVKDWDKFSETAFVVGLELTNYYESYYEYPISVEDSLFQACLYRQYGFVPPIYKQGIIFKNDTLNKKDVIKVFLKGPNHDVNHLHEINPFDYESGLILPVNLNFLKFVFQKGDILMGLLLKNNLCDTNIEMYPSNFICQRCECLDYDTTMESFYRTINMAIKAAFVKDTTQTYNGIFGRICYKAHLQPDTLILDQKCEPFDGKYDTSPMIEILNKPLYEWAKNLKLNDFNFAIRIIPDFFEPKKLNNDIDSKFKGKY